jgi:hypothetical protein
VFSDVGKWWADGTTFLCRAVAKKWNWANDRKEFFVCKVLLPKGEGNHDHDTMTARISVAMATYNGAAFLEEQLLSLSAQTVLAHELWVTDDGSKDSTLSVMQRFSAGHHFQYIFVATLKGWADGVTFFRQLRCAHLRT